MEAKIKQRIVGVVVLVVLMLIVVPLLFTGSKKTVTGTELANNMPAVPPAPVVKPVAVAATLTQAAVRPVTDASEDKLALAAPTTIVPVKPKPKPKPKPQPKAVPYHAKPPVKHQHRMRRRMRHYRGMVQNKGKWTVQVASFTSKPNANALQKKLSAKKLPAYVKTAKVGAKIIHRVYVGPEISRDQAVRIANKLHHTVKMHGMIVRL
ncbi:MAG: SPOR domain-containing protein [Gammaproteobacteria bacterium]|nr:SPOR domain-containing protein [Gammaproteobacteria bacterium]